MRNMREKATGQGESWTCLRFKSRICLSIL